jgi:hypothetical protein
MLYEKELDVRHRNLVLWALQGYAPGTQVYRQDGLKPIDGWLGFGRLIVRGVEIKRRRDRYGMTLPPISSEGYMIDVSKIVRGLALAAERRSKLTLAVDLVDGLWAMTIAAIPTDWLIDDGGRYDRDDPNDEDRCFYIPANLFKRLGASVTR